MDIHLFFPFLVLSIFFLLFLVPSSYCEADQYYAECSKPFTCGNLPGLSYPFWSDGRPEFCGSGSLGFKLRCEEDQFPLLNISNQDFRVVFVNTTQNMMRIVRADLFDNVCPANIARILPVTARDETLFHYGPGVENLTLAYNCSPPVSYLYSFPCAVNGEQKPAIYGTDAFLREQRLDPSTYCKIIVRIPFPADAITDGILMEGVESLQKVLKEGVRAGYMLDRMCERCDKSGGICGYNSTISSFSCLCSDRPYPTKCGGGGRNLGLKIGIGVGAGAGGVIIGIASIIFFIYLRRKKKTYAPSSYISQSNTSDFSSSKSDIEKGGTYHGVHLFTYGELEEATNNFDSAKELGEGGFGTVYYGKLQDGRSVAVKRLFENNYRRAEQFMNEVDILTRLRHQNLVSLYGFTSRHGRELLLVYEYISNGTVADHLHGEKAKPGELPWCTRMKIAIETASALSYLHAREIIHRDVKTNNILLDNNFCVKVADFGLSRLFPLHLTHVSTAPQGTPGYVDPEYHQCYQLTSKSDVYSFGVVLVELISSLPAVDITRHRHEINLSNMAINKIQSGALHELVDQSLGFQSDYTIRNMITAVAELAFQCLQSVKDLRPSMKQVLETLELIRCKDYNNDKAEEAEILSDDVGLLKNAPLPPSPNTVMMKWTSDSSTPSISS